MTRSSKVSICIILLFLCCSEVLKAQWEAVGLPLKSDIRELTVCGDTVFATDEEQIFRSINGGVSWSVFTKGRGIFIHPQTKHYYRVDPELTIFKSSDYGQNWIKVDSVPTLQPYYNRLRLTFDGPTIYAYDYERLLRRDSLNAWSLLAYSQYDSIQNCVVRGDRIWLATWGVAFYSPDAGGNWTSMFTAGSYSHFSLAEVGDTLLYCGSGSYNIPDGYLYRSTDNGDTWQADSTQRHLVRLFRDNAHFYAADAQNNIYVSPNGLTNWDTLRAAQHGFRITDVAEVQNELLLGTAQGVLRKNAIGRWVYAPMANTLETPVPGYAIRLRFQDDVLITDRTPATYSNNRGDTWIRQDGYGPPEFPLLKVENVLVGKSGNRLMRCVDDNNFDWQPSPNAPFNLLFLAVSNQKLYAIENAVVNPRVFRSEDHGDTWTQTGVAPSFATNFYEPHVPNNFWGLDDMLIGLSDNELYVSDNEGQSWTSRYQFDFSPNFQMDGRMLVIDGQIFVVSWLDQSIFVSKDNGFSFDTLVAPKNPGGSFIFRAHGSTFLLGLNDGFVYHSSDFGENWTKTQPPRAGFDVTSGMSYHTAKDSMIFLMDNANGQVWRLNVERLAKITGRVFVDYDADGLQDSIEPGVKDMVARARNSPQFFGVTDEEGNFSINIAHLADTLALATTLTHFIPQPAFQIVQATDTLSITMPLKPIALVTDVAVNLVATTVFRPGFENILVATLSNNGVLPATGVFHLVLDSFTNLLNATPLPDWQSGDTLFWQYEHLFPLQKVNYQVQIETSTSVALGYIVRLIAEAASTLTDVLPLDNVFSLESAVVGSYDPNDKAVSPLTVPPLAAVDGEQLTYTIRFQNTGTFPTAFVVLRDTLSQQLDLGSIRMLASSHPFKWGIHGQELTFRFDPLLLPPAQDDEIGSHGFVQFSIEMKPGAMLGDTVRNTAQIYFDYNLPIVTNTVEMIVKEAVSSYSMPYEAPILCRVYPNPTQGEVWLDWSESKIGPSWIRLLTAQGAEVLTLKVGAKDASIRRLDLSNLPSAVYFVVFEMPSGKKSAISIYKSQF